MEPYAFLWIVTLGVFLLWGSFGWVIAWAYKKLIWDPYMKSRKERFERARRMADRHG